MKYTKLILVALLSVSILCLKAEKISAQENEVVEVGDRLWNAIEEHNNTYNHPRTDDITKAKSSDSGLRNDPSEERSPGHMLENVGDNKEIRKQTIKDIVYDHKIDQAFKEAKEVDAKSNVNSVYSEPFVSTPTMTDSQLIRNVLSEELAQKKIDFDFDETNLGNIITMLGETGNINIILDPALKNNQFDLHLKNATIEETLLLIASSYDLGFDRIGDSLFVTKKEKLKKKNAITKIIKLKHIKVQEAKTMVQDIIGSVSASDELNSLIVVGDRDDIVEVEKVIKQIDQPQPQVILEAKIIEVNRDALKDVGVDWSDQINLSYQESGRPVDFSDTEKATGSPIEIFSIARNPIQLNTVIRMLENQNKAKVLSNPRVTTLNNQKAEIFVGDRIPYTITNVTGGVVTTDVRWVEPGIRLSITPSIIEDDFVVILVKPEVSFIYAYRGPNDEFPQVKTREATAYLRIKNNEPFVLGGLLNQEDKNNLYKVPMLGSVPLFGNLFSYEKHSVLDTELIITIIPTVVRGNLN